MDYRLTPVNIDRKGRVVSLGNDKIALIDADTMVFTAALSTEVEVQVFPEWAYTAEQWKELQEKLPSPDTTSYWELDLELTISKVKNHLDDILLATGCKDYELHFSEGKETFRHKLTDTYKANRSNNRYPADLPLLKAEVAKRYNGVVHTKWEADDAVIAKYDPEKYILVAIDKDVLNSVAGKHYNYYYSAKHSIDPKWVEVDEETAWRWKYEQTLSGDKTDGIIGLYGYGKVKSKKLIAEASNGLEAWTIVLDTYKTKDRTEEDAILNMRLVNMHQLQHKEGNYELTLWEPLDAAN